MQRVNNKNKNNNNNNIVIYNAHKVSSNAESEAPIKGILRSFVFALLISGLYFVVQIKSNQIHIL